MKESNFNKEGRCPYCGSSLVNYSRYSFCPECVIFIATGKNLKLKPLVARVNVSDTDVEHFCKSRGGSPVLILPVYVPAWEAHVSRHGEARGYHVHIREERFDQYIPRRVVEDVSSKILVFERYFHQPEFPVILENHKISTDSSFHDGFSIVPPLLLPDEAKLYIKSMIENNMFIRLSNSLDEILSVDVSARIETTPQLVLYPVYVVDYIRENNLFTVIIDATTGNPLLDTGEKRIKKHLRTIILDFILGWLCSMFIFFVAKISPLSPSYLAFLVSLMQLGFFIYALVVALPNLLDEIFGT